MYLKEARPRNGYSNDAHFGDYDRGRKFTKERGFCPRRIWMYRTIGDRGAMRWHRARSTSVRNAHSAGPERLTVRAAPAASTRLADAPTSPSADFLALPGRAGQQNLSSFV